MRSESGTSMKENGVMQKDDIYKSDDMIDAIKSWQLIFDTFSH